MRWMVGLLLLTGCDLIFQIDERVVPVHPLESTTHDEDGDGFVDAEDLCPHQAEIENRDSDADGIGDRCDPRPNSADDRYFISFEDGKLGMLQQGGLVSVGPNNDSIVFGDELQGHAALVLPVTAAVVDFEIDVTIVAAETNGVYSEIGLFSAHREFDTAYLLRGDVCFFGTDESQPERPNFLEFNNDDAYLPQYAIRFTGSILGLRGIYSHTRTPERLGCAFTTTGTIYSNGGPHLVVPRTVTGTVALTTTRMRIRLEYLWAVTPRL